MMSKNNEIYSVKIRGRKDEVVEKFIEDSGFDEDYERNVCQNKNCREFSVFVYDGMMLCFRCAENEIGEDRWRRQLYREVMSELLREVRCWALIDGVCMWCGRDETDIVCIVVRWNKKKFRCTRCNKEW